LIPGRVITWVQDSETGIGKLHKEPFNMGYDVNGILILGMDPQGIYYLGVGL
jgi:hypothetical protein